MYLCIAYFFSLYIYESSTLGKPYGLKLRCYRECRWEQFGNLKNLMGTWWKHVKNTLGTWKTSKRTPSPPPKRKKQGPSWVHAKLSHWLHDTFISKTICHHFWHVLMAGAHTVGLWCDLAKVFLTSRFSYLVFSNPTANIKTGTASRWTNQTI
jgi:hypothetical protein